MSASSRHKWGKRVPSQFETVRQCTRCELKRVTRHDDPQAFPWVEWQRDGARIFSKRTPRCDARLEVAQ